MTLAGGKRDGSSWNIGPPRAETAAAIVEFADVEASSIALGRKPSKARPGTARAFAAVRLDSIAAFAIRASFHQHGIIGGVRLSGKSDGLAKPHRCLFQISIRTRTFRRNPCVSTGCRCRIALSQISRVCLHSNTRPAQGNRAFLLAEGDDLVGVCAKPAGCVPKKRQHPAGGAARFAAVRPSVILPLSFRFGLPTMHGHGDGGHAPQCGMLHPGRERSHRRGSEGAIERVGRESKTSLRRTIGESSDLEARRRRRGPTPWAA